MPDFMDPALGLSHDDFRRTHDNYRGAHNHYWPRDNDCVVMMFVSRVLASAAI